MVLNIIRVAPMTMRIIDFRPPKIAQLFVLVAIVLHWATPLKGLTLYSNPLLGIVLGISGFAVMMWGWLLFQKYETAVGPTADNQFLVTAGVYRISRNPMYLGMVGILVALAIFVGSLPFYVVAIVYFFIINNVFCPYEEKKLISTFGDKYLSYKNSVRRWF